MELVLGYIGLFSSSFMLAITLWPFASLVLTLPILAGIYHRSHRLHFTSAITAYISVLYALGLLAFTLYPMPDDPAQFCATTHKLPQLNILQIIPDLQGGLYSVLQVVMNIIFFMPMGFMLCRWAKWKFWVASVFALGCSVFIETSQLTGFWGAYPCAYRQFDVDDMLTNTVGAMLGFAVAKIYTCFVPQRVTEGHGTNRAPGIVHRTVAMLLDFLFAGLVYVSLTIGIVYAFFNLFTPMLDGRFMAFSLIVDADLLPYIAMGIALVSFLVFELLIPVLHHGQTLGCMYTHMTVETRERHGWNRFWFYCLRTLVLGALFMLIVLNNDWFWAVLLALFVFWMFAKRMPWDMVPGQSESSAHDMREVQETPHDEQGREALKETSGNAQSHETAHLENHQE